MPEVRFRAGSSRDRDDIDFATGKAFASLISPSMNATVFPVGRDPGIGDLQLRLVNVAHLASSAHSPDKGARPTSSRRRSHAPQLAAQDFPSGVQSYS
jgi:hypothetical protein